MASSSHYVTLEDVLHTEKHSSNHHYWKFSVAAIIGCGLLAIALTNGASSSSSFWQATAQQPALVKAGPTLRTSTLAPHAMVPASAMENTAAPYDEAAMASVATAPSLSGFTQCLIGAGGFCTVIALASLLRRKASRSGASWSMFAYDEERTREVLVQDLPYSATWQMLKDHFGMAGKVEYTKVFMGRDGPSRGIVRFETPDEAEKAVEMMGQYPMAGQAVTVSLDYGKPDRSYGNRRESNSDGLGYPRSYRNDSWNQQANTEWTRSSSDRSELDSDTADNVQQLLKQRDQHRQMRQYGQADEIRDELGRLGVYVNDRTLTWSTQAPAPRSPRSPRRDSNEGMVYRRDPNDQKADGSEKDEALAQEVAELLQQRQQHRQERAFDKADQIRDQLRANGVFVNDDRMTWSLSPRTARVENGSSVSFVVSNLPMSATWQSLKDHFKFAGDVQYTSIFTNRMTGEQTDRGLVRFGDVETADIAQRGLADHPFEGNLLEMRADTRS